MFTNVKPVHFNPVSSTEEFIIDHKKPGSESTDLTSIDDHIEEIRFWFNDQFLRIGLLPYIRDGNHLTPEELTNLVQKFKGWYVEQIMNHDVVTSIELMLDDLVIHARLRQVSESADIIERAHEEVSVLLDENSSLYEV